MKMADRCRSLRRVIERKPRAVYLNDRYSTFYVTEHLECGHTITVYPQADALTAVRRVCRECDQTLRKQEHLYGKPNPNRRSC